MNVKFWGVRGSVPAPLTNEQVGHIVAVYGHELAEFLGTLPIGLFNPETVTAAVRNHFSRRAADRVWTHGGNTSCVSVEAGGELIILDMGTGLRELGNSLIGRAVSEKHLRATFLLSHVHWDHIQGLPFFKPLYLSKENGFRNDWTFYGGTEWYERAEECLRGQMDPPHFPVSWREIETLTHQMRTHTVHDGLRFDILPSPPVIAPVVHVLCKKLDHPQETYGYRIECGGKVIAYTTDHEPRLPAVPYKNLLALVEGADLWITDCQYTAHQYQGTDGPQRFGWGHAYPEAIGRTAKLAGVKKVITFHHDPDNDTAAVKSIAMDVRTAIAPVPDIHVVAAHEGLVLEV